MNPMIIMALLSFGMMYYMPKMMEGMDPEALEELRQSQASAPNLNSLPDLSSTLANMLSSSSSSSSASANGNGGGSAAGGSKNTVKNKNK